MNSMTMRTRRRGGFALAASMVAALAAVIPGTAAASDEVDIDSATWRSDLDRLRVRGDSVPDFATVTIRYGRIRDNGAVIGTPVAISIAMELGQPLEPFVLAVLFGANLSFVTPMAYKTNLLVMNAGGYRFGDFVRAGTPLTLIMWLALTAILAVSYGL